MEKVLVAGGTGLLGTFLVKQLNDQGIKNISHGHKSEAQLNFDMTDFNQVKMFLDKINPKLIVNLVCLSDVEKNEKDYQLAKKLNIQPVVNISKWINSKKENIKFIQVSTDHVYDKEGTSCEEDVVIKNNYAETKFEAEKIALSANALILRTNFFGRSLNPNRESFTDWIDRNIDRQNFPLNLFNDVYFSPIHISTLSKIIIKLFKSYNSGVYNLGSKDGMSKAQFALEYSDILKNDKSKIKLTSIDKMKFAANRPKGMMMNISKFEKKFNIELPSLREEIKLTKIGEI